MILRYDIHRLVTLVSVETTAAAHILLQQKMGHFSTDEQWQPSDATILLAPMDEELLGSAVGPHEMTLLNYQGEATFLFTYRARPDYAVQFGKQLKLFYNPHHATDRRIGDMVLYLIGRALARNGGLICHGSSVERNGRLAIIIGPPMVKKTMITLHLLEKGWRYLSDDVFIMHGGTIYNWESSIALRGDHIHAFRWLHERISTADMIERKTKIRRSRLNFAARKLPTYLHPLVKRLSPKEFYTIPIAQLFPGQEPVTSGTLTHALLLAPGHRDPSLTPMTKEEGGVALGIVQRLFPEKYRFFQSFAQLVSEETMIPYEAIITANIAEAKISRLAAPVTAPLDAVVQLAEEALSL